VKRMCEVCGEYAARYVCNACGRRVCEACFDPQRWMCIECLGQPPPMNHIVGYTYQQTWLSRVMVTGFFIVFVGIVLMVAAALLSWNGGVSGGAVVFIGPIPIILGSGVFSTPLVILAIVLTVIGLIFYLRGRAQPSEAS
jgi:uncharacterized membrane protein